MISSRCIYPRRQWSEIHVLRNKKIHNMWSYNCPALTVSESHKQTPRLVRERYAAKVFGPHTELQTIPLDRFEAEHATCLWRLSDGFKTSGQRQVPRGSLQSSSQQTCNRVRSECNDRTSELVVKSLRTSGDNAPVSTKGGEGGKNKYIIRPYLDQITVKSY